MLLKFGFSVGVSSLIFWFVKTDFVVVDVESPTTADSLIMLDGFCLHQADDDRVDDGDVVEEEFDNW